MSYTDEEIDEVVERIDGGELPEDLLEEYEDPLVSMAVARHARS